MDPVKTYQILAPVQTHFRKGTCEEADCPNHARGWRTVVDERLELGQKQAHYIRRVSRRSFTEERDETGLTVFTFPAGQQCFTEHKVRLDRDARFVVRHGSGRGGVFEHARPEDWVDDFATHQQKISDIIERG